MKSLLLLIVVMLMVAQVFARLNPQMLVMVTKILFRLVWWMGKIWRIWRRMGRKMVETLIRMKIAIFISLTDMLIYLILRLLKIFLLLKKIACILYRSYNIYILTININLSLSHNNTIIIRSFILIKPFKFLYNMNKRLIIYIQMKKLHH
jgi:hypothetical protein